MQLTTSCFQFVDGWVRLLENEDYTAAFYYTTHYPSDQWTPDLMRAVVKGYGESNPAQKVTLHGKPTETWQRKEVSCRDEPEFGAVGNVWYDLNIEGDLSDLTATFTIYKNAKGFIVVLEQIHLM
ncbi:hypothetical protein LP420_24980 [Massilia sp. B-10]|nr:hypothetical protein LP420_24980 [Massilia sp. B-10]